VDELQRAIELIPASTRLLRVEGAGHDLGFTRGKAQKSDLPALVADNFKKFIGGDG
jgi:hypothetical protein